METKINKHDIFVFIISGLFVITLFIISLFNFKGGNIVKVYYYNEMIHEMKLNEDEIFEMNKDTYDKLLGDLIIEIKDGKVSVIEQTSKYNYCEYMGKQDKSGTSIICAPNGVVITIEGNAEISWGPGEG